MRKMVEICLSFMTRRLVGGICNQFYSFNTKMVMHFIFMYFGLTYKFLYSDYIRKYIKKFKFGSKFYDT